LRRIRVTPLDDRLGKSAEQAPRFKILAFSADVVLAEQALPKVGPFAAVIAGA
jgi:hypothetical protein